MTSRAALNLGLLLTTILLIWVLLASDSDNKEAGINTLINVIPEEPSIIKIHKNNNQTIVLSKQDTMWKMKQPYEFYADLSVIQQLLAIRRASFSKQYPASPEVLSNTGLSQPIARLMINDTEILFGDLQPINEQRYIKIGNSIYLINDRYTAQVKANSIGFVDRHLIPQHKTIQSIFINGKPTSLSNTQVTQWQNIKANWISHTNTTQRKNPADLVNIQIHYASVDEVMHLQAYMTDLDMVISNGKLDYHLSSAAAQILGIAAMKKSAQ